MSAKHSPVICTGDPERIAAITKKYRSHLRPIIRSSNLYLSKRDGADEDRFICAFKATWQRLDRSTRRELREYWGRPHPNQQIVLPWEIWPKIEVVDGWSGREASALGRCMTEHHALCFWTPAVNLLPEPLLQTLIAHEIGHVYYRANWPEGEPYDPDVPEGGIDWEELEVRGMVQNDWGFDEEDLSAWARANSRLLQAYQEERDRLIAERIAKP